MTTAGVWEHIRGGRGPTPRRVSGVVRAQAPLLGDAGVDAEDARLAAEVLGVGPLAELVVAPDVTDVLVNGTEGVWADRGEGLSRVDCEVGDAPAVRRLAVRLAGLARRRLDDSSPYVDGLLPGGLRLHAILPPLVDGAAHISLRVPRRAGRTLAALRAAGSFPRAWEPVLRGLVAARISFVISGGTGSGKTTLLSALLHEAADDERIILVEDVRELAIDHPHVICLQSRPANVEGHGAVDLVALVRQSLRMRPDRVVVGEVRGAEVREMLTALNTGHEGGCGTIHANSSVEVLARFEALGALAGMTPAAVRTQLASAVQVVVHLRRRRAGRYVERLGVIGASGPDGNLVVEPALVQDTRPAPPRGPVDLTRGWEDSRRQAVGAAWVPERDGVPPGAREPGWTQLAALLAAGTAP